MKVEQTSRKKNIGFVAVSLFALFAIVLTVSIFTLATKEEEVDKKILPNARNYIRTTGLDVKALLKDSLAIYSDSDVSIFALKDTEGSKIVFAYNQEPTGSEKTDKFFIHVYLKDSTLIRTPFYNFTFASQNKFSKTDIDGTNFYFYKKLLASDIFEDNYIPFDQIASFNIGRFSTKSGRSLSASNIRVPIYKIISIDKKVIIDELAGKEKYTINQIDLFTSQASFNKIKEKRNAALKVGVLITNDDDVVKGDVSINGTEKIKTEFRLKGDWTDHLDEDKKWSYRIIAKDTKTILGMRKVSVQHPKARNYQWEWLFNKVIKDEKIIALRYDFVSFNIHIKGQGTIYNEIMALEESFDKILIENNKKREGVILGFDEDLLWKDRYYQQKLGLKANTLDYENLTSIDYARVKVYNENKVLSDPKLLKQFNVAKDLMVGLKSGKYTVSDVFDLDKLTTYVAINNLFGGDHALVWHNLRIYYNPITNKLEPISFDSNSGQRKSAIKHYPFSEGDTLYAQLLMKKLVKYSSQEYINSIFSKHGGQLNSITEILKNDLEYKDFDPKTLEYNSNFIKKYIYPSSMIAVDFVTYKNDKLVLDVKTLTNFPVEISGLYHQEGQKLNVNNSPVILNNNTKKRITFTLKKAFDNAFVSKKNKKGGFKYPKDVPKLRIEAQIIATNFPRKYTINAFSSSQDLDQSIAKYKSLKESTFESFDFIKINERKKEVLFVSGAHEISKSIKIPSGYSVIIPAGFSLDLKGGASFHSKSAITAKGTKERPINFISSDGTGGGLFVTNAATASLLDFCSFTNLSNPTNEIWEVSGAVNFHESDVSISNTQFKNNRCEDALNVISSDFTLQNSQFYDTFSDSFDGDFVTGTIKNCQFYNSGNDSIDVSGSQLVLENVLIENPSDKGVSAGEASTISGNNITVENGEIGIVSKDLSKINFTNVILNNTRLGFSAFQKKPEYGTASIIIKNITQLNNETDFLIEIQSSLLIDNVRMPTVSNKVIDQMYGNEYGKSTK